MGKGDCNETASGARPMGSPERRPVYRAKPMALNRLSNDAAAPLGSPRSRLHQGCAGAVLAVATAFLPVPAAHAQGFSGTPTVNGGAAAATVNADNSLITVNQQEVLIDWQILGSGNGTYEFLPAGATATFRSNPRITSPGYTVLNRLQAYDTSLDANTTVPIGFYGTVASTLNGSTGGNVWFYAPGGIVIGSTATFDVGGLVLTTNPIDTTGGLYGSSGEIRFRGAAGSSSAIQIASNARINALVDGSSYVAMVAPRIEQGGTVTVNGSTAYVAAEQADIKINNGLFDIAITAGSSDPNGIVHTGTTTGPASNDSSAAPDPQRIYIVAVPKNNAMTMLLSGTMGYTAAASAVQDNSAVVLSAGYDVANGVVASDPNATAGQTADISISRAYFPSTVTSHATGNLSLSGTGGTLFDKQASFQADKTINMSAGLGSSITSLSDLTLKAGRDEQGGAINVSVFGAGPLAVAAPGFINIAGTLMLDASATGDPASSAGLGAIGLDAAAGTINVLAAGGGLSANRLRSEEHTSELQSH